MKESEVMINTNTRANMQTAVNLVFTHSQEKEGIKLFGERGIAKMIN